MLYTVEIEGLATVEADSKEEAIEKVKDMFYDEELTIDNLFISCDDGYEE